MKQFWKELEIFAILASAVAVVWLAVSLWNGWRPTLEIDIDTDRISHASCYIGEMWYRLDYANNREVIDELCCSLSGSYRYAGMWDGGGTAGGGINSVSFFDVDGNLTETVLYRWDGHDGVCIPTKMNGRFYVYIPVGRNLGITALVEAGKLNGYL